MKLNRRSFLGTACAVGIGASRIWAESEKSSHKNSKKAVGGEGSISKIRVAQIKVYPDKGKMKVNHRRLTNVLKDIEKNEDVDVVVTPEGFLDGYVSTDKSVTKADMVRYAIEPLMSDYARAVSKWAMQNKAWVIYGCTRRAREGVFNTALIYNRKGLLVGMYDKLHLQGHDHKYRPGKHLDVYESDFGRFGGSVAGAFSPYQRANPAYTLLLTTQTDRFCFLDTDTRLRGHKFTRINTIY
jgi:hypothetical protein